MRASFESAVLVRRRCPTGSFRSTCVSAKRARSFSSPLKQNVQTRGRHKPQLQTHDAAKRAPSFRCGGRRSIRRARSAPATPSPPADQPRTEKKPQHNVNTASNQHAASLLPQACITTHRAARASKRTPLRKSSARVVAGRIRSMRMNASRSFPASSFATRSLPETQSSGDGWE